MTQRHLTLERIAEGELNEAERQHLEACALCRADALLHSEFEALVASDEPPTLPAPGSLSALPFALIRWLGAGTHGAVYEALNAVGERVAVKVLVDGVEPREECLDHPNLVCRRDSDFSASPRWIATEFIGGAGLLEAVDDRSEAAGAAVLLQILSAVETLHGAGLAHGHLCAANVRQEPGGRVVVLDAGLEVGSFAADIDAFRCLILEVCEAVGQESTALRRVQTLELDQMRPALEDLTSAEMLGRYEERAILGVGGMGKVHRVFDADLVRTAAMKVLGSPLQQHEAARSRFLLEARVTAQLQHPGIVPVYEIGRLPDGRPYYTMMEVEGQTLTQVIAASRHENLNIRRLVMAYLQACETVAYAHARGVLHRDLKPANVMVGEFGEVRVLDWGLARISSEGAASSADDDDLGELPAGAAHQTRMGDISGTAAFMPPEQARGDVAAIGAHSDVYALGAILYQILAGVPPYVGTTFDEIVAKVLAGPPEPPAGVPETLESIRRRAMERDPADRYNDAGALADALRDWLEDAKRRERALEKVARSDAAGVEERALQSRATSLRERGAEALAEVPGWAPVEEKLTAWALQDHAAQLEQQADQKALERVQHLRSALIEDAALPEAHGRLAEHYAERHSDAEARRDSRAAAHYEQLLRLHDRGRYSDYLAGTGTLTLHTVPSDAAVTLYRYCEQQRRLVASDPRELGSTPIDDLPIERGSWLLEIRPEGRPTILYPVAIGRGEHWDSAEVHLPEDIGDAVWVAAGWFWSGGGPLATGSLRRRRLWADDFAIQRYPVTNREYIAFLNDLVSAGREAEAIAVAPRERGTFDAPGALIYGFVGGTFFLQADADGDVWLEDWPVVFVTMSGAEVYASWLAARTGRPWRLPTELEWEKAARGVDGRTYPWGDFSDPTWARSRESTEKRTLLAAIQSHPLDESPYGVRGMAGNVRDRCADLYSREEGPALVGESTVPTTGEPGPGMRTLRGGSWGDPASLGRCAGRTAVEPEVPGGRVGFRLAFSPPR